MRRSFPALSLSLTLFVVSPLAAEIDKSREEAEEEKEREARPELDTGDDHREFHENLAREGEENLKEIQRLLDEVNDNLSNRNTGSGTQKGQKQAVERMKQLIDKLAEGCKQCQQGGGGGSSGRPQKSGQQNEPKDGRKKPSQSRENQRQLASEKQRQQQKEGQIEDNRDRVPNENVADDEVPENGDIRLSERLRKQTQWGFLPPKVREEMLSATGKDAPPEYREIVERYYKRISDYYDLSKRPTR